MKKFVSKHFLFYLAWLSAFGGVFLLFIYNQLSAELADPDAFYHMKMAQLFFQQGVVFHFSWLPYTTLSTHFTDQHLLYHILMIPFVIGAEPFIGIKLFTAFLGTSMLAVFAWLLRSWKLRWWWLVSGVLAFTVPFTFRLNLVKATPLALIFLCIALYAVYYKKYWLLVCISALFVWAYGGFPILLVIITIWVIADWLATTLQTKRWLHWPDYKVVGSTLFGIIIGIIINPYFPNNLWFYWEQFYQIGVINYQDVIGVGSEWYPYNIGQLWLGGVSLFSLAVFSLTYKLAKRSAWQREDWFALGIAMFGLVITLKSRRYVEYYGPLMAFATCIWLQSLTLSLTSIEQHFTKFPKSFLKYCIGSVLLIMAVTPTVINDVVINKNDVRNGILVTKYQRAMQWLYANGKPNTVVLHSDWDDFPSLFYYDDRHAYIAGLDPTFTYRYSPELYHIWEEITLGSYPADKLDAALQQLQASYVVIEQDHADMYTLIQASRHTHLVYEDDEATIFSVEAY